MRHLLALLLIFVAGVVNGQTAFVSGIVKNESGRPIELATISLSSEPNGTNTDPKGSYRIEVPADKRIVLNFSFVTSETQKVSLKLKAGEEHKLDIVLKSRANSMKEVVKRGQKTANEAGSVYILDPKHLNEIAGPGEGLVSAIKSLVGSRNELTSQYTVRGGNYDENLVYVNDFEIYRPFLVRSGQQEGLSFVNSDLVSNVNFSLGGFQAKYGDKMSSVLDVTYKRPTGFAGTAMLSLLGANLSLEGASKNQKFTYLVGLRQKSNQYFLQSQATKGVYNPSFTDFQADINYRFNPRWELEMIGNYARNRFSLTPEESVTTFGVIDQAYQLRVFYNGGEIDQFDTRFGGLSLTHRPSDRLKLKLLVSGFQSNEKETYDISGEYLLGALETDLGKSNFGQIKYAIGTGIIQNFARNYLKVNTGTVAHRGSYDLGKHTLLWGIDASTTQIDDRLHQWQRRDSAGYTQPYNPDVLTMQSYLDSKADFTYARYSGFLQDNFKLGSDTNYVNISAGVRFLYSNLNQELDISPRLQATYRPKGRKDVLLKAAIGMYVQPPMYREMRAFDGSLNYQLKSQKSMHYLLGAEQNFKWGDRPLRVTLEGYYKNLTDLVPYVYEDVRIRYSGRNNSNGYAYGAELRLYGDLVKDATSWVSIGLMKSEEDLTDDKVVFKDQQGQDSAIIYPGYSPRPTDQRVMVGVFLQDYLPHNKNFKVNLNLLYASGIPFYTPENSRYGQIIRLPDYKRVDIGFSALLLDAARKERPRYSFFSNLKSVWASLEVFNLLGIQNTLSYSYIQDQTSGKGFAVPNRLTSRLLNVKLIVRF
ncbi:MAG: TonB-dependent receptor [Bacteroidetes bacterium]|nr:TonB-dependent receptor [Bacteroidota bacterium]